ncbi:L,D-transpeptidase family protein [Pseudohoeflea sp. DP4N28-3]|uniref:L,D-transpeptidase family protein n=2 Tax=Pseudohoeflea coraliihabitans TaxID=2860393 RepID=A0ABS6WRH7_9HYPH|nr:L,D-transpeptidase family protein [Pseudohoeflea sp. DP4N28-3]
MGVSGLTIAPPQVAAGALDANFIKTPQQRIREFNAQQDGRQDRRWRERRIERRRSETRSRSRSNKPTYSSQAPIKTVSGPSYKTYAPDRLVRIDLSQISDPMVTASTSTAGFPPLGFSPFEEGRQAFADIKLRALPETAKAVIEIYSSEPEYLWVAGTGLNDAARAAIAVLQDADAVGLSAQDYQVAVPADSFDIGLGSARQRELMRFEMALSAAVGDYILDASRGRVDPNRISGYHDFKRKQPDLVAQLKKVATSGDAAATLRAFNPQGDHFAAMVVELERLRQLDAEKSISIDPGLLLKPGQASSETKNVVAALRQRGSEQLKSTHALLLASYIDNEEYDPDIVALVRDFQKEAGLRVDGIVGPRTVQAIMGESSAAKITKLKLAMERARWLPGRLADRRVFINQPAYTASYYENGKKDFETRVVVGTAANQTYFFDDKIERVEFNPSWGVPQSIIFNEMMPRLRRDPSYLDRLGYRVTYNGRSVSSSAVNWYSVGYGTVGVRQPPGPKNALGQLKIMFPNKHAIYMHDTPAKSLFNKDMRAFSHGCVRLQDPRGMAARVLGTSVEQIGAEIAGGQNKPVPVPEEIPVHVAYFTAWPSESGEMQYFADVYDRDRYLQKAIEATESERQAAS